MAKLKGLGRGLDALLSNETSETANGDELRSIQVGRLQPGKYQPRTKMDTESLQQLADSIRTQGVVQPILVRAVSPENYEIIAGERRWRASQMAGLTEIPALIRDIPNETALAVSLIENIQRENLNPLEEAAGIQRLINEFEMTHQAASEAVGRSRSAVSNLLRLLNLPHQVQELVMSEQIDMGHARALLPLEAYKQAELAHLVASKGLSVRETERMVQKLLHPSQKIENKVDQDIVRLEEELSDKLGTKVNIKSNRSGKGKMVIQFNSLEQFDSLLKKLT
ncbi:MAG: ParB/RepB/Spo0J family partition protein [Sulfuricellaceae bacterium]|nr:ParB/RepB/Spo0J family partition protein [Sulfuricellaceae bacterium]